MTEQLLALAATSLAAFLRACEGLVPPLLGFAALALAMRRGRVLDDLRRVAPEVGLNFKIAAFNALVVTPGLVVSGALVHGAAAASGIAVVAASVWDGVPAVAVIAVAVLAGDMVGYWRHRLEHTPALWPTHAVHHSDTEMTWTTLLRIHPINRVTTFLIDTSVLLLLGLPPYAIVANTLVRHYYGYLVHADLPWTYGPLGRIFVSPAMHRWHHAADVRAFNTNYATVFSFIDRAFGTWRVPGPCDAPLGVADEMARGLTGQLTYPFAPRAYRGLLRRLAPSARRGRTRGAEPGPSGAGPARLL